MNPLTPQRFITTLLFVLVSISFLLAQNEENEDRKNIFINSPFILKQNDLEINVISSLTSHWVENKEYSNLTKSFEIASRKRLTNAIQIVRVFYGFSKNGKWDLGVDFKHGQTRLDENARSSIFKVFNGEVAEGNFNSGITFAGARLRYAPISYLPNLTVHAFANFEVVENRSTGQQLGASNNDMGLNVNYFHTLNDDTHYQLGGTWGIRPSSNDNFFFSQYGSASGFLIADLYQDNWFAFGGLTYNANLNRKFEQLNNQLFGGLGVQYQSPSGISAFIYAQIPFIFESGSFLQSWVRESYSSISLGIRYEMDR